MNGGVRDDRARCDSAHRASSSPVCQRTPYQTYGGGMNTLKALGAVGVLATLSAAVACIAAAPADKAAVALKQTETAVEVTVDGKPFTTYRFAPTPDDPKFVRPYFYPVQAADGTALTSDQATSG